MNKHFMTAFLLLVFMTAFLLLALSPEAMALQDASTYRLWCRSPLQITTSRGLYGASGMVGLTLSFTRNPVAAGVDGRTLGPGTCAWIDRPVASDEPAEITLSYPSKLLRDKVALEDKLGTLLALIVQRNLIISAALSDDKLIRFDACNSDVGTLLIGDYCGGGIYDYSAYAEISVFPYFP
jgi:hypothetical protein